MLKPGDVLKAGHWMYDGTVRCRVEIQYGNIRYGSGDYEDEPEWRDDQPGDWFFVSCASPTSPDICPPWSQVGGGLPSLEEAIAHMESQFRDCQLEWEEPIRGGNMNMQAQASPPMPNATPPKKSALVPVGLGLIILGVTSRGFSQIADKMASGTLAAIFCFLTDFLRLCVFAGIGCVIIGALRNRRQKQRPQKADK